MEEKKILDLKRLKTIKAESHRIQRGRACTYANEHLKENLIKAAVDNKHHLDVMSLVEDDYSQPWYYFGRLKLNNPVKEFFEDLEEEGFRPSIEKRHYAFEPSRFYHVITIRW